MNKNFHLVLSTLLMTIATNTIGAQAQASPVVSGQQLPQPIVDYPRVAAELLKPSVPVISASGIRGNHYFIRVKVAGTPLKRLIISLPEQVEEFEQVSVLDQDKHSIPAEVEVTQQQVTLIFAHPVIPETTAEISFDGVHLHNDESATLLYRVTAQTVSLSKEILVGTAKIKVPEYN